MSKMQTSMFSICRFKVLLLALVALTTLTAQAECYTFNQTREADKFTLRNQEKKLVADSYKDSIITPGKLLRFKLTCLDSRAKSNGFSFKVYQVVNEEKLEILSVTLNESIALASNSNKDGDGKYKDFNQYEIPISPDATNIVFYTNTTGSGLFSTNGGNIQVFDFQIVMDDEPRIFPSSSNLFFDANQEESSQEITFDYSQTGLISVTSNNPAFSISQSVYNTSGNCSGRDNQLTITYRPSLSDATTGEITLHAENGLDETIFVQGLYCGLLVDEPDEFAIETSGSAHKDKTISWNSPAARLSFDFWPGGGSSGMCYVYAYESNDCSGTGVEVFRFNATLGQGYKQGAWNNNACNIDITGKGYHSIKISSGSGVGYKCIRNIKVSPDVYFTTDSTKYELITYTGTQFDRWLILDYANHPELEVSHTGSLVKIEGTDRLSVGEGCGTFETKTIHISGEVAFEEGVQKDTVTISEEGKRFMSIPITVLVTKREQALAWTQNLAETVSIVDTLTLTDAVATSGLTATFSSEDAGVHVDGNRVYFSDYGTFDLQADQKGDNFYAAAESVTKTITVLPNDQADLTRFSIEGFSSSVDPTDGSETIIPSSQQINIMESVINFTTSAYATVKIGSDDISDGGQFAVMSRSTFDPSTRIYTLPTISVTSQDGTKTQTYTIRLQLQPRSTAFLFDRNVDKNYQSTLLYKAAKDYYGDALNDVDILCEEVKAAEKAQEIVQWYDVIIMPHLYDGRIGEVYRQLSTSLDGMERVLCLQYELINGQYSSYGWPQSDDNTIGSQDYLTRITGEGVDYSKYRLFDQLPFVDDKLQLAEGSVKTINCNDDNWIRRTAEGSIYEQHNWGYKKVLVIGIDVEANAPSASVPEPTPAPRRVTRQTTALSPVEQLLANTFTYLEKDTYYDEVSGKATVLPEVYQVRTLPGISDIMMQGTLLLNPTGKPLRIYNASGRLLTQTLGNVDLTGYPTGLYFICAPDGQIKILR
ncbi:MAG: hypothetical protein IJ680_01050 [Paludibacteraceae bacterium]|nr:hypothetical protein [Paludibacteraceae bacterium]